MRTVTKVKVVVVGPPHSGKSVFLGGVCALLPREEYFLFRACPDGEGNWTYRSPEAASYRRKGRFSSEVVDWYVQCLKNINLARLVLVDVGGRISGENKRILIEGGVTHAIVLSGDREAIPEWERFCEECGVAVIATIHSDYNATEDVVDTSPMVCHHLERGEDVSSRPAIQKVAMLLIDLIGREDQEMPEGITPGHIEIPALAKVLGKEEAERTLPNGVTVRSIMWSGTDLPLISRLLHNRQWESVVEINGAAPGWLVATLVHEVHPSTVKVNSVDGYIPVGCQKPAGMGSGVNLEFKVTPREDGWIEVLAQQASTEIPLNPVEFERTVPPDVPFGAKVIISGRLPLWATAALSMAYHGRAAAVACFQPGVGSTVVWTHTASIQLGEVIK